MRQLMKFLSLPALVLGLALPAPANADDANKDWNQSMGFESSTWFVTRYNAAQAIRLLQKGGATSAGGSTSVYCQVVGACPSGGTVTQWNGVTVNTVTDSTGITIDNDIDADATQDAEVSACSELNVCEVSF